MTRTYRRRDLVLAQFAQDFPQHAIIRGKTFEDCFFHGPAIAFFPGCTLRESDFGVFQNDVDSILWEISPSRTQIVGAILFDHCTFLRCKFEGIGIVANSPAELSRWRAQLGVPRSEPPNPV